MRKIMFHLNCLEQGGAERVVSNLANRLCREDLEIVVTTEWEGVDEFQLDPRVKKLIVGPKASDEKKSRISKMYLRIKYLRDCIKEEKPDVVIAFTRKPIYRALQAAGKLNVPIIIAVRTDPTGHYEEMLDKIQIPWLFPRASGAVFQTKGQRDFFPEYLRDVSTIILNPVSDKYLDVPKPAERENSIVQSGRLVDFKNQPMLIDAFMKVHAKHPEFELKIYGPDSFDGTKEILEAKIKEYQAEKFIHLMGGSDELEKQLPQSKIYAFSSDWEGLPNALIEAMALGMPIVATDCPCGGPATIMTDGYDGLLVPIKDPDALAEGIIKLIENPELAEEYGMHAREIVKRVNSDAVIDEWRNYIDEVIQRYNSEKKHNLKKRLKKKKNNQ